MTDPRTGALRGASFATLAITGAIAAAPAHAGAFYLADQSTKATGRAYSGEVSEQGAQQQYYNPAAIGGIDSLQSYFGLTAILPHANAIDAGSTVTRPGLLSGVGATTPVGGNPVQHNPVNKGYLPNGGFAIPLPAHLAFGFTMASPYSFTTNYGSDSWARYSADRTRLRTFEFQPSIAWSPAPSISFGAAPVIDYVRATFSNYLPDPLSASLPDGHQLLKGSGWDVGYTFGFQFHNDKVDIGASYKSAVTHHLKGHLIVDGISAADPLSTLVNQRVEGARATFTTPWSVSLGMRYHVTKQFTVNTQATRFGWSKFSEIALSDLGPNIGNQAIAQNYKNSWAFSVGFDYDVTPKLTVRGGVARDLTPVQKGYRDPRVPDGDRWDYATGLTYKLTRRFAIDAAASYAHIAGNTIDKPTAIYDQTLLTNAATDPDGILKNGRAVLLSLGGHMSF